MKKTDLNGSSHRYAGQLQPPYMRQNVHLGSRAECALHNQVGHKEKRVCTTRLPHFPKSSSRSLHSERWSRDTHVTMDGENLLPWEPERETKHSNPRMWPVPIAIF